MSTGAGPSSPQWKTTLCKNYQEDGRSVIAMLLLFLLLMLVLIVIFPARCEFGDRCQFAHGQLELRTLAQNYLQLNPQYKTILCSHFSDKAWATARRGITASSATELTSCGCTPSTMVVQAILATPAMLDNLDIRNQDSVILFYCVGITYSLSGARISIVI